MTNLQGDFIWYELLTSDADAAQDFYGKVIGWICARLWHARHGLPLFLVRRRQRQQGRRRRLHGDHP